VGRSGAKGHDEERELWGIRGGGGGGGCDLKECMCGYGY